jgi:hypothetical protein
VDAPTWLLLATRRHRMQLPSGCCVGEPSPGDQEFQITELGAIAGFFAVTGGASDGTLIKTYFQHRCRWHGELRPATKLVLHLF